MAKTSSFISKLPIAKKDGSPYVPWAQEAEARIAKREAGLTMQQEGKRCTASTTGVHGPKRPCTRFAMWGQEVCYVHGGGSKAAKNAAKARLIEELDPTISRMIAIRDQDDHLPSALGAATHLLNRVMGKPDAVDKDKGAGRPIIQIGVSIGGLPGAKPKVGVRLLEARAPETVVDAELASDENECE